KREHLGILRKKKFESAAGKGFEILSCRDHAAHPPKERRQILLLILDVDRFVVVLRVDDDGQMELLRIGKGRTSVAIGTPSQRRAAAVAIAKVNVVAHA